MNMSDIYLIVLFKTCKIRKLGTAGVPIFFKRSFYVYKSERLLNALQMGTVTYVDVWVRVFSCIDEFLHCDNLTQK